jgi:hypothetical protein
MKSIRFAWFPPVFIHLVVGKRCMTLANHRPPLFEKLLANLSLSVSGQTTNRIVFDILQAHSH